VRVELLWFEGCPNHEPARHLIAEVLAASAIRACVEFIEVLDAEAATRLRFPGSPTIRVDGKDIEPDFVDAGPWGLACRTYRTPHGLRGVPERAWLERALTAAGR
jgi:hypothetical protein